MIQLFTIGATAWLTVLTTCFVSPSVADAAERTGGKLSVAEMTCEYATNPLGIDTDSPRFSWISTSSRRGQIQTAYQLLVAADSETLAKNQGDQWDSGKIALDASVLVPYQGATLPSGGKYYWKVRVWDKDDRASAWSDAATFEMGLLREVDWQGKWIGPPRKTSSSLLRREFDVAKEIRSARVYMSGLGWSELYVNGEKVSDRVLDPAMSYFDNVRYPELGSRVLYVTHDITEHLKNGRNAMGVLLGNGWYTLDGEETKWRIKYGKTPILLLQMIITYADGTTVRVASDPGWKVTSGPITVNDICFGETHDARLEKAGWDGAGHDDSAWDAAVLADPPSGALVSQRLPGVKVMETIKPVKMIKTADGRYVYDFGQNFSGWVKLRVSGPRGTKVTIRYAGTLKEDSSLNEGNLWGASQSDSYILKGGGEEVWEPRFTLHGFRYAEVEGFPGTLTRDSLEGRFAYNAVETDGSFQCSNALLNQIHRNVRATFKSSLQGIPQDAADRNERVAWLGDTGFVAEDYIYNFDTALFWAKWMNDLKDSQKKNGDVPVVSPLSWSRDSWEPWPCWKSTYPLITWYLYQYYGDVRVVEEHYDALAALVAFLGSMADNHIIKDGLGDHMEPDRPSGRSNFRPKRTPSRVTSTGMYYYDAWILAQMAKVLGKTDDHRRYSKLAGEIKDAFNKEFLKTDTNQYSTGSQTATAMALHFGLVPQQRQSAVLKNLVDDIMVKNEGHLSTGIMGANALEQVLGELGRADVMYQIATKTTFPSWGYSISKGATTVWESFEVDNHSLNMKMFCSTEKFFYKDLAGISPTEPGYRRIRIKPRIVGDLTYVKASVKTVRGLVAVHWAKGDNVLEVDVTIPVNSQAKVHLPKMGMQNVVVAENGKTMYKAGRLLSTTAGISAATEDDQYVTFDVGSGSYAFRLSGQ